MRILIREVRRRCGFTQTQLASALGKSRSAIAMYETGKNDIPWSVLVAIARVLGVAVTDLWEDEGTEGMHTSPAIIGRPPLPPPPTPRAAVHALPPRRGRASRAKY